MSTCQAEPRAGVPTRRSWPQSSAMPPLAALPTVPAMVRAFVRAMLSAWQMDSLAEDAELIASELAGNAVAAFTGSDGQPVYISGHMPVVQVCLLTDGVRILLEVWDQAPGIPVIRDTAGCEESGRGLVLIDAIADRWGWSPAAGRPGKVVWAEMSLLRQGCLAAFWRPRIYGWSLRAIKGIFADVPRRADLRRWFDEVLAEEEDRGRITRP